MWSLLKDRLVALFIFENSFYFSCRVCVSVTSTRFSGISARLASSVCAESSGGPQPAEGVRVQFIFTSKSPRPALHRTPSCRQWSSKCVLLTFLFQDLLEKLKEAEESHGTLQAECEQYRTVLAETVIMLNYFDSSRRAVKLSHFIWLGSSASSGRNAETPSEERGRGGGGVEVQDG